MYIANIQIVPINNNKKVVTIPDEIYATLKTEAVCTGGYNQHDTNYCYLECTPEVLDKLISELKQFHPELFI